MSSQQQLCRGVCAVASDGICEPALAGVGVPYCKARLLLALETEPSFPSLSICRTFKFRLWCKPFETWLLPLARSLLTVTSPSPPPSPSTMLPRTISTSFIISFLKCSLFCTCTKGMILSRKELQALTFKHANVCASHPCRLSGTVVAAERDDQVHEPIAKCV